MEAQLQQDGRGHSLSPARSHEGLALASVLAAERTQLQEAMSFLGALCCGLEDAVGGSAQAVTYLAGRNLGRQLVENAARQVNLEEALEELRGILNRNDCHWDFHPFQRSTQASMVEETPEGKRITLVFRDCMIRQALFRYGHPQKGSLCNMMFGVFAGALGGILGSEARLEILHAGENACLKTLTVLSAEPKPVAGGRRP